MSATNLARRVEPVSTKRFRRASVCRVSGRARAGSRRCVLPAVPSLRVLPLLTDTHTRRFVRVPTHAVGVHPEHRAYPRATLRLPLRLRSVNSVPEKFPITLVTRDISSTGVYFLCPKQIAPGHATSSWKSFWSAGRWAGAMSSPLRGRASNASSRRRCPGGTASPPPLTTWPLTATIASPRGSSIHSLPCQSPNQARVALRNDAAIFSIRVCPKVSTGLITCRFAHSCPTL